MKSKDRESLLKLIKELVDHQEKILMRIAERYVPNITTEDLLQPNDYAELEVNPNFRYEEGVLHGLKSLQSAVFAHLQKGAN